MTPPLGIILGELLVYQTLSKHLGRNFGQVSEHDYRRGPISEKGLSKLSLVLLIASQYEYTSKTRFFPHGNSLPVIQGVSMSI